MATGKTRRRLPNHWKTRLSRDTLFLILGTGVFIQQVWFEPSPSEFLVMVSLAMMGSPIFLRVFAQDNGSSKEP